jgi:FkbH-like protein
MELLAGFPYTSAYADSLACSLAEVLWPSPPRKGLITDLDDTLWAGIVGEIGVSGVAWLQESHAQIHGLYQQMLGSLASSGILLAVASKNEQATAEAALARKDLLLDAGALFPVVANWGPKSVSVAEILRTWNIGADAVVFVDDNPMELEEVRTAFPAITCLHFARKDPARVWQMLGHG